MNRSDAARLLLLDRIADRVPELDLDHREVDWATPRDGHEALLVDGGGIDGGDGDYLANAGDDVHAVGSSRGSSIATWRFGRETTDGLSAPCRSRFARQGAVPRL